MESSTHPTHIMPMGYSNSPSKDMGKIIESSAMQSKGPRGELQESRGQDHMSAAENKSRMMAGQLWHQGPNQPPKVIVCTKFAHHEYRLRGLALGASYFLDKSEGFQRIPGFIKVFLAIRKL